MNKVTIIGSINLDRTIRVEQMPKPGETMHTLEIFSSGGGKGANQAVAAQRLGAQTFFIGGVGNDESGQMMRELLVTDRIEVTGVATIDNQMTGQAYIIVDCQGENSIMIHTGANNAFTAEHVRNYRSFIEQSDFVIAQFESSLASTLEAFQLAKAANVTTILNPAPALAQVSEALLQVTDLIIPNETETEILTGIKVTDEASLRQAADAFHQLGIKAVIITLGSQGAFFDFAGRSGIIPAFKVKTLDTTAAGDTFIGGLSSVLNKDFSNLEEAILYGNKASSLTVQSFGAQPSIPYQKDII